MELREVTARSILTPTGGFLAGFSHTLNPYGGCSFGRSFCGAACYASELRYGEARRHPWGGYLHAKVNGPALYRQDHDRWRRRREPRPLGIFMSSVTDPWVPQERRYRITGGILREMLERPPDALVLQTHTPNPLWDLDVIAELSRRCALTLQISVETDRTRIPGFPRHAYAPAARIEALATCRARGVRTCAVVAPLMPIDDPPAFAAALEAAADFVIVDHYLIGDGSKDGTRTRRAKAHLAAPLPEMLRRAGFDDWNRLDALREIQAIFESELGVERVGISAEGFNRAVARGDAIETHVP